jgi:hypothetical protein
MLGEKWTEAKFQMEQRNLWEAQYWWAFSCLVLAGRRTAQDFHAELVKRSSGTYPDPQNVEAVLDEALTHLSDVLNLALVPKAPKETQLSGWRRHVVALCTRPEREKATDQ